MPQVDWGLETAPNAKQLLEEEDDEEDNNAEEEDDAHPEHESHPVLFCKQCMFAHACTICGTLELVVEGLEEGGTSIKCCCDNKWVISFWE